MGIHWVCQNLCYMTLRQCVCIKSIQFFMRVNLKLTVICGNSSCSSYIYLYIIYDSKQTYMLPFFKELAEQIFKILLSASRDLKEPVFLYVLSYDHKYFESEL